MSRYKYGRTIESAIPLEDNDFAQKLAAENERLEEDASMENVYERPSDRLYAVRNIKQEDEAMLSADRLRSPARMKREDPHAQDDAKRDDEVTQVLPPPGETDSFWQTLKDRSYSLLPRTARPIFKQEHPADYQDEQWVRYDKLQQAKKAKRNQKRQQM